MVTRRALAVLLAVIVPIVAVGDGPPKRTRAPSGAPYAQASIDAYGDGYAMIERATRLEHDAGGPLPTHSPRAKEASASPTHDRQSQTAWKEARLAYEDALAAFEQAVSADPKMYEAHTYIGYANRKLGRYEGALSAYATALRLKPDYTRAIQYQGEAYLGLDRFEDAKRNYLRLYALDLAQAQKLLDAMHRWHAERTRANAPSAHGSMLASAAAWIESQPQAPTHVAANPQTHW